MPTANDLFIFAFLPESVVCVCVNVTWPSKWTRWSSATNIELNESAGNSSWSWAEHPNEIISQIIYFLVRGRKKMCWTVRTFRVMLAMASGRRISFGFCRVENVSPFSRVDCASASGIYSMSTLNGFGIRRRPGRFTSLPFQLILDIFTIFFFVFFFSFVVAWATTCIWISEVIGRMAIQNQSKQIEI